MSDILSDLDDLINDIANLGELNGRTVNVATQQGTAGSNLRTLKERLRGTTEEANDRLAMEKAMQGQQIEAEKVDGVVHEYIRENILKDFNK